MRVLVFCAAPRGSRSGNRRTAERWARLLRALGHRVRITSELDARPRADVLIALHARHAATAIRRARALAPSLPIVLALTGTDLDRDIHVDARARRSLELADRLVVLHELAPAEVPAAHRGIVRVIRQSAQPPRAAVAKARGAFEVVVVGHLRAVKDPLRTALAVRRLPATSRVRVVHAGAALDPAIGRAAEKEQRTNPRYRWLGDVPPGRAVRLIARAHLFVLTSRSEGGANVLGEAAMAGTPVLTSDIPAARAALGVAYPGVFPVGDTAALAAAIARAESDPRWLAELTRQVRARRSLFAERREKACWRDLLRELSRSDRKEGGSATALPARLGDDAELPPQRQFIGPPARSASARPRRSPTRGSGR